MKVVVPLTENLLPPLEITAVASAIDAEIQKEVHGSGRTTLIISNEKMNGVKKTVQSFKDSNILLKKLIKQMKIEQLNKKRIFGKVIMYFRSSLVRKYVNRIRNFKSWLWKQRKKTNVKNWLRK